MAVKTIISASRRTDIPAFYLPWFMKCLKKGSFRVVNPYNNRSKVVPAGPDQVHSIVFWSKNFGPFIKGEYGRQLEEMGYHLFFNFTINSTVPVLEPAMPPLENRLEQLGTLSEQWGPRAVSWRFDPLSFFRSGDGNHQDNLADFPKITAAAFDAGIERCITSFMDVYPKIKKRVQKMDGFMFYDLPIEKKIDILYQMQATLAPFKIALQMCCEGDLLTKLPDDLSIAASSCVPGRLLAALYGDDLSLRKDAGQRVKAGCGCSVSVDVGSYKEHPCYHRCLYCYASPAENRKRSFRGQKTDPEPQRSQRINV